VLTSATRSLRGLASGLSAVRLHPHDTSTEEGRSKERWRRMSLTVIAGAAARGVNFVSMLVYVPFALTYLGPERFGVWMLINSFSVLFNFADLGMGAGVITLIGEANGRSDVAAQRALVTNAYLMLAAMAVAIGATFALLAPHISWRAVLNVGSPDVIASAQAAIAVYAATFIIGLPFAIIQNTQAGLQQSYLSSLWLCGSSVVSLACVLCAMFVHADLPALVFSLTAPPIAANILNSIFLFRQRPDLAPRRSAIDPAVMRKLFKTGALFFIIQMSIAISYGADNLIVTHYLGAAALATYAVTAQLFGTVNQIVSIAMTPIWPAYSEALARGDRKWAISTLKKMTALAVMATAALTSGLLLGRPFLEQHWTRGVVEIPLQLALFMMAWKIVESFGNSISLFMNGANIIKTQAIVTAITAAVMVLFKTQLIQHVGITAIPIAALLAYTVFTMIPYLCVLIRAVA